jgi:hypothetical protein
MKKLMALLAITISLAGAISPASATAKAYPVSLTLRSLGIMTNLIPLGLMADGSLAVPPDDRAAGWFTGGPKPGTIGPAVIVGHVDWKGKKGPFFYLTNAKKGQVIVVNNSDFTSSTFVITKVSYYKKTAFPTKLVYGNLSYPGLRLITCGIFNEKLHAYVDDFVVYASLKSKSK